MTWSEYLRLGLGDAVNGVGEVLLEWATIRGARRRQRPLAGRWRGSTGDPLGAGWCFYRGEVVIRRDKKNGGLAVAWGVSKKWVTNEEYRRFRNCRVVLSGSAFYKVGDETADV